MSGALSVHCTPKEDIFEIRHYGRVKDTELPAATIAVVTDIHGQVEIGAALPLVSNCAVSDAGAPNGWCPNGSYVFINVSTWISNKRAANAYPTSGQHYSSTMIYYNSPVQSRYVIYIAFLTLAHSRRSSDRVSNTLIDA